MLTSYARPSVPPENTELLIVTTTLVLADVVSLLSGSSEMPMAFKGRVAVVLPVVASSSNVKYQRMYLQSGELSTISKLPNKSVVGNVSSACIS